MTEHHDTEPRDVDRADPDAAPIEVVVSAERLVVGTEWVVAGRLRVRRRIVTERRTVEVDVRREIVEIEGDDLDFRDGRLVGVAVDGAPVGPPAPTEPLTVVLREEVPRVEVEVRPYERVTVTTTRVRTDDTVHATLAHEQIDLQTPPLPR